MLLHLLDQVPVDYGVLHIRVQCERRVIGSNRLFKLTRPVQHFGQVSQGYRVGPGINLRTDLRVDGIQLITRRHLGVDQLTLLHRFDNPDR